MELLINPIPRSDWWIFVRAVQTRDHYVVIRVIKQHQRATRYATFEFSFGNKHTVNLRRQRKNV